MMNAETLLACLNTLQISRGKDIIRVRDIKEIPGQGWNYTMDYKIKNSRHDYMETSFNNLIPRDAFDQFIRSNPEGLNTTSTEGLHKPVPQIKRDIVDDVKLGPASGDEIKLTPGTDPEITPVVEDDPLNKPTTEPQQPPPDVIETPKEDVKLTILKSDGESTVVGMDYHQKMIKKYGEVNLPYTVIGTNE